jgi:hypothetical protein
MVQNTCTVLPHPKAQSPHHLYRTVTVLIATFIFVLLYAVVVQSLVWWYGTLPYCTLA